MFSSNKNQESSASDDFADNDEQKPFFVTQADYTDYFCKDLKSVKEVLASYNLEFELDEILSVENVENSCSKGLIDLIREDSEKCITKEVAINNLKKLKDSIQKLTISPKLKEDMNMNLQFIKSFCDYYDSLVM